jgi:predicted enzyme related to lactoylglutathione lyase
MYRAGMTVALEAGLVAREPQALCAFYERVMQFRLVERLEHAVGTVYKLRRDAAQLKIFFSSEAVDPVTPTEPWFRPGGWRYAALHLETFAAVDELAAAVAASEGRVLIPPTSHRAGARMALVCDPEGNAWELLAEA